MISVDRFFRACRNGSLDEITLAAASGLDINAKCQFGMTGLQNSIAQKQPNAVLLLLTLGADPAVQDSGGCTSLHYAIEHNMPVALRAMVDKSPDAISVSDRHGNQPLWTAVFNAKGNYEMVTMLLDAGADLHHLNNVSLSPMDIPKRKREPALLELLEAHDSRQSQK